MTYREHREKSLVELAVASGTTSNRHIVEDALAMANVHARLALAAAVVEVASAIRTAGRPMGGRS